nr:reverse transcriptase domain-containing protein [Tanacetum cinerariifolium]
MTNEREMTPPLGFSTLTPLPDPNASEIPPITTSNFTYRTPENTPLINHASTLNSPYLMISLAFVDANYEVLESLLREHRRQRPYEDLRTKLEYFREEYDEEREIEPKPKIERNDEGGRPLAQRTKDNGS